MGKKNKNKLDSVMKLRNKEQKMKMMIIDCLVDHPEYIRIIKSKYIDDDLIEDVMRKQPELFKYIKSPSLRIINVGLEIDGGNLKYVDSERVKGLPVESFGLALESNPREAVKYIPKGILSNDLKLRIFDTDPDIFNENHINIDEQSIIPRIHEEPSLIKYIPNPSESLKCMALKEDPYVALYFDTMTPSMMDIIDEYWPQYRNNLPNYTREIIEMGDKNNGTENCKETGN